MDSDNSQTAWDHDTDVSSRVVREVADALGTEPLEIDPLYESIDPDALNDLFRKPAEPFHERRVEFTMQGCDVVVYGDGEVEVAAPGEVIDYSAINESIASADSPQDQQRADGS
jgi:hypothetical protein